MPNSAGSCCLREWGWVTPSANISSPPQRSGKDEQLIESGSGRFPVWQWVVEEQAPQSPVVGFGFGYGDAVARLFNRQGLRMMHMHNAILSALLNLGACGLAILGLLWGAVYRQVLRIKEPLVRTVLLGAVTATIANSMAMESVSSLLSTGWIGHLLLFGSVAVAARGAGSKERRAGSREGEAPAEQGRGAGGNEQGAGEPGRSS